MRVAFLLSAVLVLGIVVKAQDCSVHTDCNSCTKVLGCGFCAATGQCTNGTTVGPDVGACYLGWYYSYGNCPNCSTYEDCGDCTNVAACGWCTTGATGSCNDISTSTCVVSKECPCNVYGQCETCLAASGCGWCSAAMSCVPTTDTTCLAAHTCPACSTYNDCNTCSNNWGCVWCDDGGPPGKCTDSTATCSFVAHSCTDTVCDGVTTCADCINTESCSWCAEDSSCKGAQTTCLFLSHTCEKEPKGKGFSAGSFVGGMFLVIGLGLLAVGGYFGYRYYKKRASNYTEV
eukprot:TRINITY_DN75730_c0_g1_i1.p3 TRINITY_DN75730_c0_g1~~TRINITY_DN75730_c0_g1_i1.p3  ORF type:complete len:289 (+),score=40.47 TRINITY_DN75730_c0_g1_i1:920-1786(+)